MAGVFYELKGVQPTTLELSPTQIIDHIEGLLQSRNEISPGGVHYWPPTQPPNYIIGWYGPGTAVILINIHQLEPQKIVLSKPRLFLGQEDEETKISKNPTSEDSEQLFQIWSFLAQISTGIEGISFKDEELPELFEVYRALKHHGWTQGKTALELGISTATVKRLYSRLKDGGIIPPTERWK